MALEPVDEAHALQIQAGILGRKAGHRFEDAITERINSAAYPLTTIAGSPSAVAVGDPADLLLRRVASALGCTEIIQASAISTGALATLEAGAKWLSINGASVSRCKSDIVLTLKTRAEASITVGISTKQCNNHSPTNAQLYFTTARGFVNLLRQSGIEVSDAACGALRQFCGDAGYRPSDDPVAMMDRHLDPRRFFWEEIQAEGRTELETLLSVHQDRITRLLLQKAYLDDPFVPEFLLHKTKKSASWAQTEVAIYSIDDLIQRSARYRGFATRAYSVHKGSHKDPPGVKHLAPRFGIVQMQRGGQKQHAEQLQFNLEAGYFYKL